jgi:hypothetical protein
MESLTSGVLEGPLVSMPVEKHGIAIGQGPSIKARYRWIMPQSGIYPFGNRGVGKGG